MKQSNRSILVACECSGRVRDALIECGHDAYSCDLRPSEGKHTDCHFRRDCRTLLGLPWGMMICFPPCTYLCSSGMHWTTRGLRDPQLTEDALDFVVDLLNADIPRVSLENSTGCITTRITKTNGVYKKTGKGLGNLPFDQKIQPYQFGDDASKGTCLWLKNLPKLVPTKYIEPRMVDGKPRWANQTDGGQNRLGPSEDRGHIRGITYPGVARAIAFQWGHLC